MESCPTAESLSAVNQFMSQFSLNSTRFKQTGSSSTSKGMGLVELD